MKWELPVSVTEMSSYMIGLDPDNSKGYDGAEIRESGGAKEFWQYYLSGLRAQSVGVEDTKTLPLDRWSLRSPFP